MSEEVKFLEEHLKRPLFNIDEYEPEVSDEDLLQPEYRKCYRLNESSEVTALNLFSCRLEELDSLAFLTELNGIQSLTLSGTGVRDLSELVGMKSLRRLDLSCNTLRDVRCLAEIKALESLDLSGNELSNMKWLATLKSLRNLNLSGSGLIDVRWLTELTNLRSLYLNHNRLSNMRWLAALKNLKSLNLSQSGPIDVRWLVELKNLESLNLGGNGISNIKWFAALKNLRILDIDRNRLRDVSCLTSLHALQSLNVSDNEIHDVSGLARLMNLKSLNVGRNGFKDLGWLTELQDLRSLNLSENGISDIGGLVALQGLESLNLSENGVLDVSRLVALKGLENLNLSGNKLTDVRWLGALKNLKSLYLSRNGISDVSVFAALQGLQSLDLSRNKISDVEGLAALQGLESLNLSENGVRNVSGLVVLKNLKSLNLRSNGVRDISMICSMNKLRSVDLSKNAIKELKEDILHWGPELEVGNKYVSLPGSIKLYGNDLQTPPMEIVNQGHQAVVDYFHSGKKKAINEFKLVLVGEGGAGKTTLVKQLMGEDIPEREAKTDGISIREWEVPNSRPNIQAHIWDFGGQEIMHATHQFFLSKRSLYVLVLDGRKEEDAEYWLDLIKSFGGDSPVIIVLNKIDENPSFDINDIQLKKDYPNIYGVYRTSAKKGGLDFDSFKLGLQGTVQKVEITSTEWPVSWFDIKKKLEALTCPFIEFLEYQQNCNDEGITSESEQNTLVQFLNDLGSIVYFEDPHLELTQVLNPEWVTTGVYRILNAKSLADAKGLLRFDTLKTILKKRRNDRFEYPMEKYSYLLELMCKFELCYRANEQDKTFMIPDLLDVKEPRGASTVFEEHTCLSFEFEYDFLPKSLFNRFMVRKHKDIKPDMLWRTGVVMKDPHSEAQALIKVDHKDRKVLIQVLGVQRREYFSVLRREFLDLHDEFESLDYGQWIPLPDHPDHRVDYEDLVGRELMGEEDYISGKLRKRFSIKELLEDVVKEEERLREFGKEGAKEIHHHDHKHYHDHKELHANNSTIQGDLVVADQIINSFNKTANSSAPDEVKQQMAELKDAMPGLLDSLEAKDQKKLGKRVATLNDEIAGEDTDVGLCEFALEEIAGVAKQVGAQGLKVVDITTKLLPLLQVFS